MLSKLSLLTQEKEKRYERKFVIPCSSPHCIKKIRALVLGHPANLSERYPMRRVNSLYFDSPTFTTLLANTFGVGNRYKMRLRWYGETFGTISGAQLELKVKSGYAGTKLRSKISPFELRDINDVRALNSWLLNEDIPDYLKANLKWFRPTLINSYERYYFENQISQVRVTLDTNLTYYGVLRSHQLVKNTSDQDHVVLEVKYPLSQQKLVKSIMQLFPYRLNRKSKYASGVYATFV